MSAEPVTLLDAMLAVHRRYDFLLAIEDPDARIQVAREALLAFVPEAHRLEAGHLIHTIGASAGIAGEAFVAEELRLVARHFGGLEHAIMAVHAHVVESATTDRRCSCPAGDPPDAAGPPRRRDTRRPAGETRRGGWASDG